MANEKDMDYLSLSDEEIANMVSPAAVTAPASDEPNEYVSTEVTDAVVEDDNDEAAAKPAEEESDDGDKKVEVEEVAKEPSEEKVPAQSATTEADTKPVETPADSAAINYEAEYKRLLAPFKANGREIKVNDVNEAVTLMQMGANYNKKMAALKPNLKLMKLLENNGLLSEEKIGFLIDLGRKDPAAINKLVKDSGIDPMDLSAEQASAYKQTAYTVDDREIELDTILDEIQSSPTYNRTLEVVSTKWDAASKNVIASTPQILKVINGHMESGIYDLIVQEVESERMFGRLNGVSDIEAYRRVGDTLHAKGAFTSLLQGSSQQPEKTVTKPVVIPPKAKANEDALKDKRRAASSTKPVVASSTNQDFDPLALSDEEFNKLVNKRFL